MALLSVAMLTLACGAGREDGCTGTALGASQKENTALKADCNALLAVAPALAGTATLNWSADAPLTSWDGIVVSGTPPRVTQIDLRDRGLTGSIPPALADLTALAWLRLMDNPLTGCVPNALWGIPERDLEWLDLASCTRATRLPRHETVGAGDWFFDDYSTTHSGPCLVITVESGRQVRWASTLYADGESGPGVFFQLEDVATGIYISYDSWTAESGMFPTPSAEIAVSLNPIMRSARMEPIRCGPER